jgi:hypothetical protein
MSGQATPFPPQCTVDVCRKGVTVTVTRRKAYLNEPCFFTSFPCFSFFSHLSQPLLYPTTRVQYPPPRSPNNLRFANEYMLANQASEKKLVRGRGQREQVEA